MTFVRTIGRWAMTGLVINCIIGSAIFGVTAELIRLLGPASPIAVVIAALMMAIIMACVAEVASSFTEPGGAYLYVRTAFGRFAGLQVGWFWLLATVGGGAAASVLDADYLGEFLPWAAHGWVRALLIATLITVPAAVNYAGVRSGANLSNALVVAKLLPIGLVIALGLPRLAHPTQVIGITRLAASLWEAWVSALLLMLFC
jgi:basic amino acid/polyamine antiporter, APA family